MLGETWTTCENAFIAFGGGLVWQSSLSQRVQPFISIQIQPYS